MNKTVCTHKRWLPQHNQWVHFVPRSKMARKRPMAKATLHPQVPVSRREPAGLGRPHLRIGEREIVERCQVHPPSLPRRGTGPRLAYGLPRDRRKLENCC